MDKDIDYIRLVDQARLGDKESLEQLVKLAKSWMSKGCEHTSSGIFQT